MRRFGKNILFPVIIGVMVLCLSLFVLFGCGDNKTNTPVGQPDTSAGTDNATPAQQTTTPAQEQPVTVTFYDGDVLYATAAADADGVTLPTAPTKEGYVFDGWFTDRNTLRIAFTPSVRITTDSVVYAKWHAVEENNGENSGENGNSGENQGENGGSTENQGENGNSGENQGENQGENNGESGENNGNENPEDPNQEDPNQGNPESPQPEQLDFSGLEAKLVEVITSQSKYNSVNKILSYSVNDGNFYVVYDYKTKRDNCIGIYSVEYSEELSTQQEIDAFDKNIKNISFDKTVFYKATSDITVDGVTYSKDGIEGDNPFARQCGVENAWMTYVSDPGTQSFANTETGYGKIVEFLVLGNDNKVIFKKVVVESVSGISNNEIYENLLQGKYYELDARQYVLGTNFKESSTSERLELDRE